MAERILVIDSSAGACSAALWRRDAVVAARHATMARGHAEALMPMIVATLNEAGESLRSLDAVAVTVGPGAFTGIRIGLATARGIGLAAGIPVVGITTFAAVAAALPEAEREGAGLLVLLDSKRGDAFAQLFSAGLTAVGAPAVMAPAAVANMLPAGPMLLAGDGTALVRSFLATARPDVRYAATGAPEARLMAPLAARLIASGTGLPPVPLYLRAADVHLPAAGPASGAPR